MSDQKFLASSKFGCDEILLTVDCILRNFCVFDKNITAQVNVLKNSLFTEKFVLIFSFTMLGSN